MDSILPQLQKPVLYRSMTGLPNYITLGNTTHIIVLLPPGSCLSHKQLFHGLSNQGNSEATWQDSGSVHFLLLPFLCGGGKEDKPEHPYLESGREGQYIRLGVFVSFVLFCFVLNTIGVSLNTFCETQTQTCLGAGFLHSIGPAVAQLENFPNFSKVDLSKADNQALTNNI